MFDTSVELIGASVAPVNVDTGQEGALELIFVSGLTFPIEGPDGGPLRIPNGQYRFRLTRDQALDFFKKVSEVAEELPKGSGLVVPSSNEEVEKVAKTMEQVKSDG